MTCLECKGLDALASMASASSLTHVSRAEGIAVGAVMGGLLTELVMRAAGIGITSRMIAGAFGSGLGARVMAHTLPPVENTGGIERVHVSLSLGEAVLMPLAGGTVMLLSSEVPRKRDGIALIAMAGVGAAVAGLVLSTETPPK